MRIRKSMIISLENESHRTTSQYTAGFIIILVNGWYCQAMTLLCHLSSSLFMLAIIKIEEKIFNENSFSSSVIHNGLCSLSVTWYSILIDGWNRIESNRIETNAHMLILKSVRDEPWKNVSRSELDKRQRERSTKKEKVRICLCYVINEKIESKSLQSNTNDTNDRNEKKKSTNFSVKVS
jgi:hypothetical protein